MTVDTFCRECCGNTLASGIVDTFCRECCVNAPAPGTVDTFCTECCVNAPAVGLDVLVAGVVAEDVVGDRDSKSIWKFDGSA